MRIKYVGAQNFIPVLILWILLCWAFGESAAEKWNAKTTARVNLRKNPSSNGVILSIVPKGHRVRTMENQGLWCKVDVEGEIHGKGWVSAEYIEEILPKVPEAETNLHTPPPEKALRVGVGEELSIEDQFPAGNDKSGSLSRAKLPTAGEPLHIAPSQASSHGRPEDEKETPLIATQSENVPMTGNRQQPSTQNELPAIQPKSIPVSPMEGPVIGKPVYAAAVQPQKAGIKGHPPGVVKKAVSEVPTQGDSLARLTDVSVDKKAPATTGQPKPLEFREGTVPNTPAVEGTAKQPMAVSYSRKGSIARQKTMGPVELVLKLMSIALTALVIFFLHRANKIATNHYKALMQVQKQLNSQE